MIQWLHVTVSLDASGGIPVIIFLELKTSHLWIRLAKHSPSPQTILEQWGLSMSPPPHEHMQRLTWATCWPVSRKRTSDANEIASIVVYAYWVGQTACEGFNGDLEWIGVHIHSRLHSIWSPRQNNPFYARRRQMGSSTNIHVTLKSHVMTNEDDHIDNLLSPAANRGTKSGLHLADSWASAGWFQREKAFRFCQGNLYVVGNANVGG